MAMLAMLAMLTLAMRLATHNKHGQTRPCSDTAGIAGRNL